MEPMPQPGHWTTRRGPVPRITYDKVIVASGADGQLSRGKVRWCRPWEMCVASGAEGDGEWMRRECILRNVLWRDEERWRCRRGMDWAKSDSNGDEAVKGLAPGVEGDEEGKSEARSRAWS